MANIWVERSRIKTHFQAAIAQALLHDLPLETILEGLVLAIHENVHEPKIALRKAWDAVDL